MKRINLCLSLISLLIVCGLMFVFIPSISGQDKAVIQESDKYGFFYYLDTSYTLVLLERQTPKTTGKKKLMGFGGATVTTEIKGGNSPLRLTSYGGLSFFVRLLSQDYDVAGTAPLIKAEAGKDKRIISSTFVGTNGKMSNSPFDPNPNSIPFKIEKFGSESLRITPTKALEPGEYCFNGLGTADYFCFGIDAASPGQMIERHKIVGKYIREKNKAEYFELNANGSFYIKADGKEGSWYYEIQGNRITFVVNNNLVYFGELRGGIVIDDDGGQWLKQ